MVAPPTEALAVTITYPLSLDISGNVVNPTLIATDGTLIYVYDSHNYRVHTFAADGSHVSSFNIGPDNADHGDAPPLTRMVYDNGLFIFKDLIPDLGPGVVAFRDDGSKVSQDDIPAKYTVDYMNTISSAEASFGGYTYTVDQIKKTVTVTAAAEAATAPDKPTGLMPTVGNTEIILSWTAPVNTGGQPITDYVIQYSSNSGTTWTTFADGTGTDLTVTVTGLTNGQAYSFRVSATNSVGTGTASDVITATPLAVPITTAPAVKLVLKAPDSGGHLLTDRYMVAHVDDTDSIGDMTVRGTGPTSADATRLTVHDDQKAYMRDVRLDSGGWLVTIPAAYLSPGDNKFFLRDIASDGTTNWASFNIIIVEKPQDVVQSDVAVSVSSSDDAATVKSKIESAASGAVVTFADGTYTDIGKITVSKPLTLKSATGDQSDSNAEFTGDITFDIRSGDVSVAGLKFVGVTSGAPVKVSWVTVSDVVIEKNLFDGTSKYGVYRFNNANGDTDSLDKGTYAERMTVDQNVFRDIGFNGMTTAEKAVVTDDKTIPAGSKVGIAIKIDGVRDSVISNNTIDKSTGSGILLNFAENVTVKDNKIDNVIADGIKVDRSASGIVIDGNEITNSAYADKFTDADTTTVKPVDSAYAAIAILKANDVTVRDNVIRDSKTGILFCKGTCDENYDPIPKSDSRSYSEGPSTGHVTGNSLAGIGMQYIVNSQPDKILPAQLNHFDATDPDAKIKGNVYYGPWYTDQARTTLAATGTVQTSNARGFSHSTCSIGLEHSSMTFSNTVYGQNSDPETQNVSNTGSSDLTGIMLESTGWKKADGTVLTTVHTDVRDAGTDTYQRLSSTETASFGTSLGANSDDKLSLEFVMDLRDASSGPAEELTETVLYLASCS